MWLLASDQRLFHGVALLRPEIPVVASKAPAEASQAVKTSGDRNEELERRYFEWDVFLFSLLGTESLSQAIVSERRRVS